MSVHIDRVSSEISVIDGDQPLNEAQLERLVQAVMQRLEERQRIRKPLEESRQIRSDAVPPSSYST